MPHTPRADKPLPPLPESTPVRSVSFDEPRQRGGMTQDDGGGNLKHSNTLPRRKGEQWARSALRPCSPLRFEMGSPSPRLASKPRTRRAYRPGEFPRHAPAASDATGKECDGCSTSSLRPVKAYMAAPPKQAELELKMSPRIVHPYGNALHAAYEQDIPYDVAVEDQEHDSDEPSLYLTVDPEWRRSRQEETEVFLLDHDPTRVGKPVRRKDPRGSVVTVGRALQSITAKVQFPTRDGQF